MAEDRLLIVRESAGPPAPRPGWRVTTFPELLAQHRGSALIGQLGRYHEARVFTYRRELMHRPFEAALLARLLSRGNCAIEDETGANQSISAVVLIRLWRDWLRDRLAAPGQLRRAEREVQELTATFANRRPPRLDLAGRPAYCRTDLVFGLRAGGSVTHVAGVLNHLQDFVGLPIFLTTDPMPSVSPGIETHIVTPGPLYQNLWEVRNLHFCRYFAETAHRILHGKQLSFLYQRYSVNNYSGVHLSRWLNVPFVLEYNGGEVWANRYWAKRLRHEALSHATEQLNLLAADLIVVVSQPLEQEPLEPGIPRQKILVNPNGVDSDCYSPAVDGTPVWQRNGLVDHLTVGFIGTFGRWHGAEVLAAAFATLLREHPEYRKRVRLLMIGDGLTMPQVRAVLHEGGAGDACVFTGLVPQSQGPAHLAACDILVAPHMPNLDGTRFIGSPTKLFEYMAMGKSIVASNLEQIGEVLEHERTAWLVPPGDEAALASALRRLIDDPALRLRLGHAARRTALHHHTWRQHTSRIINRLHSLCPAVETSRAFAG